MAEYNQRKYLPKELAKVADKKYDLINRVKYTNTLPDIPFDLKLVQCRSKLRDYIAFNPIHLEKFYRHEVLVPYDLGVPIELIDPDAYLIDPSAKLAPEDERLLEDESYKPQYPERSGHHGKKVSWLRRSEYISTEKTRFVPQSQEKMESKIGYKLRHSLMQQPIAIDRATQIKTIEETFEVSRKPITKHFKKPNVTPVAILPVFPDTTNWLCSFTQVIFDSDPAISGKDKRASMEELSNAMVSGVIDDNGISYAAYFLPTQENLIKRKRDYHKIIPYGEDDQYEYDFERGYTWNVKMTENKAFQENYFFVIRDQAIYYNELEMRVRLNKRRQNMGNGKISLLVKHRPLTKAERRFQKYRLQRLEPLQENNVDDDDDDNDSDDDDDDDDVDDDNEDDEDEGKIENFHIVDAVMGSNGVDDVDSTMLVSPQPKFSKRQQRNASETPRR